MSGNFWVEVKRNEKTEQWLINNGAEVIKTGEEWGRGNKYTPVFKVYFKGEEVYMYTDSSQMRIYFTPESVSYSSLLLVQFPEMIIAHNLNKQKGFR